MAKFIFNLPDIGEGIAEAEIVAMRVKVGDRIEEDQPVADMMTDKATVEMESPVSGIVIRVAGDAGDVIAIGSMLVEIETETDENGAHEDIPKSDVIPSNEGKDISEEKPIIPPLDTATELRVTAPPIANNIAQNLPINSTKSNAKTITASPAVRHRAKELGVDLSDVMTAGGHVRHSDLDAYLSYNKAQGYSAPAGSMTRPDEVIKVIGMRRRIADNMAASKRHIPHFTYVEEMDVTALESMRADLNANRGVRPKLTMLPFLIVAICKSIPQFPMINARYDDEAGVVTRHGAVHLGIAVQTEAGLIVPVIRNAQDKNIWQLADEITRLADAARDGSASRDELSGSTLTVTSLGALGGVTTTPVINRPEVAIIGPNRIIERPMFVDDAIEARKLMNMSISCDHRVVDGYDAASFVQALKNLIETPVLLFVD
jgi:2-oxoisovalerate dehydrogenase E2 component (dihydrolipoyl transacylase)